MSYNLTKSQKEQLEQFPNLKGYVERFMVEGPSLRNTPKLLTFFRNICNKYNLDEDEVFLWSKAVSKDFNSSGSNSRWAVAMDYIDCHFKKCVDRALYLAREYEDNDVSVRVSARTGQISLASIINQDVWNRNLERMKEKKKREAAEKKKQTRK